MSDYDELLDFWFPADAGKDLQTHKRYFEWRMRGGADDDIVARFTAITGQAARGDLDRWAETPLGRLALIIALDQFPRSVWRDDARAFAQDPKALAVMREGFDNGHFDALETVWEKAFYQLPLGHWEGPDHLERLDEAIEIAKNNLADAPENLKPLYEFGTQQPVLGKNVIARFGRHPHRNAVLGRQSTPAELEYLKIGEFPHQRKIEI